MPYSSATELARELRKLSRAKHRGGPPSILHPVADAVADAVAATLGGQLSPYNSATPLPTVATLADAHSSTLLGRTATPESPPPTPLLWVALSFVAAALCAYAAVLWLRRRFAARRRDALRAALLTRFTIPLPLSAAVRWESTLAAAATALVTAKATGWPRGGSDDAGVDATLDALGSPLVLKWCESIGKAARTGVRDMLTLMDSNAEANSGDGGEASSPLVRLEKGSADLLVSKATLLMLSDGSSVISRLEGRAMAALGRVGEAASMRAAVFALLPPLVTESRLSQGLQSLAMRLWYSDRLHGLGVVVSNSAVAAAVRSVAAAAVPASVTRLWRWTPPIATGASVVPSPASKYAPLAVTAMALLATLRQREEGVLSTLGGLASGEYFRPTFLRADPPAEFAPARDLAALPRRRRGNSGGGVASVVATGVDSGASYFTSAAVSTAADVSAWGEKVNSTADGSALGQSSSEGIDGSPADARRSALAAGRRALRLATSLGLSTASTEYSVGARAPSSGHKRAAYAFAGAFFAAANTPSGPTPLFACASAALASAAEAHGLLSALEAHLSHAASTLTRATSLLTGNTRTKGPSSSSIAGGTTTTAALTARQLLLARVNGGGSRAASEAVGAASTPKRASTTPSLNVTSLSPSGNGSRRESGADADRAGLINRGSEGHTNGSEIVDYAALLYALSHDADALRRAIAAVSDCGVFLSPDQSQPLQLGRVGGGGGGGGGVSSSAVSASGSVAGTVSSPLPSLHLPLPSITLSAARLAVIELDYAAKRVGRAAAASASAASSFSGTSSSSSFSRQGGMILGGEDTEAVTGAASYRNRERKEGQGRTLMLADGESATPDDVSADVTAAASICNADSINPSADATSSADGNAAPSTLTLQPSRQSAEVLSPSTREQFHPHSSLPLDSHRPSHQQHQQQHAHSPLISRIAQSRELLGDHLTAVLVKHDLDEAVRRREGAEREAQVRNVKAFSRGFEGAEPGAQE